MYENTMSNNLMSFVSQVYVTSMQEKVQPWSTVSMFIKLVRVTRLKVCSRVWVSVTGEIESDIGAFIT